MVKGHIPTVAFLPLSAGRRSVPEDALHPAVAAAAPSPPVYPAMAPRVLVCRIISLSAKNP